NNDTESLSLLLTHMRRVNEMAFDHLTKRIITECNPRSLLTFNNSVGYSYLLGLFRPVAELDTQDGQQARKWFQDFVEVSDEQFLHTLNTGQLNWTIWNISLIQPNRGAWLRRNLGEITRRLDGRDLDNSFQLLWNLWQASEPVYREALNSTPIFLEFFKSKTGLHIQELSIAGLLHETGYSIEHKDVYNSAEEIADWIAKQESGTHLVLTVSALKTLEDALLRQSIDILAERGTNLKDLTEQLIDRNPLARSRNWMKQILDKSLWEFQDIIP
ncbi:MAG: hypothetical protein ACE5Q6_25195, partial [Dehalococcoidia bacterium]